jgi:integrase
MRQVRRCQARSPTRTEGLQAPKSPAGMRRDIHISERLRDELSALLKRRQITDADGDALVFVTQTGAPLQYTNWRRRTWVPAFEKAGLVGPTFHDLKRPASTIVNAQRTDPRVAQTRLGHASDVTHADICASPTAEADERQPSAAGGGCDPESPVSLREMGSLRSSV